MSDTAQYAKYFSAGMKVGVGIPMQNDELFRDWAFINEIEDDLVQLQLSRDVLPAGVDLQTGKILEIRCGLGGKGYRCSGVFIVQGAEGQIHIRLSGDVNSSELREFYRINAFMPFKIQVSKENDLDAVLKEWRTRKQNRLADEVQRKEELKSRRREVLRRTPGGELNAEDCATGETEFRYSEYFELIDRSWDQVTASAVNLSGGGFKFITSDHYDMDELVFQEVFIPTNPPRIMDSVARVVFKNRNTLAGSDAEYYDVATNFVFIDERDRDAIVSHISNLELMRIRMLRQNPLPLDKIRGSGEMTSFQKIGGAILLLALLVAFSLYFQNYTQGKTKNEIQETFESGIRKYIEKFK